MKHDNFSMFRSFTPFLDALGVRKHAIVLDYGCSWGYSLYQMKSGGFDVQGFEVSKPRAVYGRKNLDVDIQYNFANIRSNNDAVVCSHAIEHLPDLNEFLARVSSCLKQDGLLVVFCPNGSAEFRDKFPK